MLRNRIGGLLVAAALLAAGTHLRARAEVPSGAPEFSDPLDIDNAYNPFVPFRIKLCKLKGSGRYAPGQWLPREPLAAAQVQRWLSVAAGPLAFGPAAARVIQLFKRPDDPAPAIARAQQLFQVMEQQLEAQAYLAGDRPTLADVANYSYVARAPEGNVSLQPYPAIRAWLDRIEAWPGFVPLARTPVGLAC